jgi:hypothetical protein
MTASAAVCRFLDLECLDESADDGERLLQPCRADLRSELVGPGPTRLLRSYAYGRRAPRRGRDRPWVNCLPGGPSCRRARSADRSQESADRRLHATPVAVVE